MYSKEIMKNQKVVEMLNSARQLLDIESFKKIYFSKIESIYNRIVNLSDLESTVLSINAYNSFVTTKDLLDTRKDLFNIRDTLGNEIFYYSPYDQDRYFKNCLENALKVHRMEDIEAVVIPMFNFDYIGNYTLRDAICESEVPEDIKKMEDYLDNRKLMYIQVGEGGKTSYDNKLEGYVITNNLYKLIDSGSSHLKNLRKGTSLGWCSKYGGLASLYIKYLYPFLVEKYYKKDITNINLESVGYNWLLIKNNFIDPGDFSRHLVGLITKSDSSPEDEATFLKYSSCNLVNFNLVDKTALKNIKQSFIAKHSLQEEIYPIDPSLFIDDLLACKNNMKLRMLAVNLLPKGDKRLNSLMSEKTYTLSKVLIGKIPAESLPFLLGSYKGRHKNELDQMIAARMTDEEVVIEYAKRIKEEEAKKDS
jgi:hypothetical protein